MRLFERKNTIQAFKLPLLGKSADEIPPNWFVSRLQSGELVVNSLGGVTMVNQWGHQQCAAGDYVVLTDDDKIEFASEEAMARFEPVAKYRLRQLSRLTVPDCGEIQIAVTSKFSETILYLAKN